MQDIFKEPLPKEHSQTAEWIESVCNKIGKEELAAPAIGSVNEKYNTALEYYRKALSEKRIAVLSTDMMEIDWALETLLDAGAEVISVDIMTMGRNCCPFYSRFSKQLNIRIGNDIREISGRIISEVPDLVIGHSMLTRGLPFKTCIIPQECISHKASIYYLEYMSNILIANEKEGWLSWGD